MGVTSQSCLELLAVLRAHESELRAGGVDSITLFGSVARGDETATSDVDLAIRSREGFSAGGFDHFGRLDDLRRHLEALLDRDVDLIEEPAVPPRLRHIIIEEGVRVF